MATIFVPSPADAETVATALAEGFPWLDVDRSTHGGEEGASLYVKVSMDPKDAWPYGIFHNSRWALFSVQGGKMSLYAGGKVPKFRKVKVKGAADIAARILAWGGNS